MRAPVAMRMPISRVRSVTLTSMMFITPMPPTSSEIAAIEPSRTVSVFCVSVAVSRIDAMLRIWKSSVPWRAFSSAVTASCVSSIGVHVVHRHGDGAQEALAEQAQAAGGQRHEDDVVGSSPPGEAPFGRHHADDLERHVVEQHVLADRIAAVGKQLVDRRSGRAPPPPRSSARLRP